MGELLSVILRMSGAGSLVILLVLLARLGLRKAPKVFSYGLWAIVLFRLLCPVAVPIAIPERSVPVPDSVVAELPRELPDTPEPPAFHRPPEGEVHREAVDLPAAPEHRTVNIRSVLSVLWLTGAVGLILTGLISNLRFRHALKESMPIGKRIYIADHIGSAFVIGFLIPSIYLDSSITGKERTYILEHEKTHIRHLDHITRNLAYLALCLHWFNPLVWLAFHLSARDMEMCCDESVIRKLGPQIRGEYSKSLLGLAAGQHLIPSVAFGEGNTRSRVMNLVNWKKASKRMTALGCTLCILVTALCACQPAPEKEVVTSKNDGQFESNLTQTAEQTHSSHETQSLQYTDTFDSTDGSVTFGISVDQSIQLSDMPVVEAVPHFLTEEECRNIAQTLCGKDTEFYEAEPVMNERFTKDEVRTQINRWAPYTNSEAMSRLFPGGFPTIWEEDAKTMQDVIVYLTEEYMGENTPDHVHTPCQWTYHKDTYYFYGEEEAQNQDDSEANDEIAVWVSNGDGTYGSLHFTKRDQSDFKLSNVYYYAVEGGPLLMDLALYKAEKLRTEKPTQDQVNYAVQKAQSMMDRMGLGQWTIVSPEVISLEAGEVTEYSIRLTAVPVFEGAAVMDRGQLGNIVDSNPYSFHYYLSRAEFTFTPDGSLMDFTLDSPVDVKQVLNENVKTLPLDELYNRAKEHLMLSDLYAYGGDPTHPVDGEHYTVTVNDVRYGLTRIKARDTEDSYYYVPAIMYLGDVHYSPVDAGAGLPEGDGVHLLILNAVDGTVIGGLSK